LSQGSSSKRQICFGKKLASNCSEKGTEEKIDQNSKKRWVRGGGGYGSEPPWVEFWKSLTERLWEAGKE